MNKSRPISFVASYEVHEALELLAGFTGYTVSNAVRLMVCKELMETGLLDFDAPLTEQAAKFMPYRHWAAEITGEAAR